MRMSWLPCALALTKTAVQVILNRQFERRFGVCFLHMDLL